MRKGLITFFGVIVVLIILFFFTWNLLPSWVSNKLSDKMKVLVSIQNIRLGSSYIGIDGLEIGNPPKSVLKTALEIKKTEINVPLTQFLHDEIVIEKIQLDHVYLGLEFDSPGSKNGNWSEIMRNIKESTKKEKEQATSKGKRKRVLIKKLIITDLNIDLAYRSGGKGVQRLRKIDRLEFENISSEGGFPTSQIADIIMTEMLRNVFSQEGLQNMLENLVPGGSSEGSPLETLKGLFSDSILHDRDCWNEILHFDQTSQIAQ